MNTNKTIIDFEAVDSIDDIITRWAAKSSFQEGNPITSNVMDENNIAYCYHQLGVSSCVYLTINILDDMVHMETWITYDFLSRLMSLFILPNQLPLDSKSPKGIVERIAPKKSVSLLLTALSQEPL